MNSILSESELKKLPRPIRKEAVAKPKIMHFGPGAFFRSFVASLINDVNQKDIEQWGIIAISLGAYGIPETIIIDKNKTILKKYIGAIDDKSLREIEALTK